MKRLVCIKIHHYKQLFDVVQHLASRSVLCRFFDTIHARGLDPWSLNESRNTPILVLFHTLQLTSARLFSNAMPLNLILQI